MQNLLRGADLIEEVDSFLVVHHISFSKSNDKFLVRVLIDRAKARYLIFLWVYALAWRLCFETLNVDGAIVGARDYRVLITNEDASNLLVMGLELPLQLTAESIDEVYLPPHRANRNMHPSQARTHCGNLIIWIMIRHQKQLLDIERLQWLLLDLEIRPLHFLSLCLLIHLA